MSLSRVSSGRRHREDAISEKDAKRAKMEPKAEPGAGVNGALVVPPPQHVAQHTPSPVCSALPLISAAS